MKLPRPKFGLRTLLLAILVCAIGLAVYTSPGRWRAFRNQQARQRIDPYELNIAGDGNPKNVPPELVAILGDSRLKHWNLAYYVKLLAGDQVISWGTDWTIRLWDVKTGRQLQQFPGVSVGASGDRKLAFLARLDGSVECWDVAAGKVVKTLPGPGGPPPHRVNLAANWDGSALVVEHIDRAQARRIVVWDVAQEKSRFSFQPSANEAGSNGLTITKDGQVFTWVSNRLIQVAEVSSGKVLRTMGPILAHNFRTQEIGQAELSTDESRLFAGSTGDCVVAFDWETGQETHRIGQSRAWVAHFALGQHDRSVLLGGQQRSLAAWRFLESAEREWEAGSVAREFYLVVDWQGDTIAASHENAVTLWRCETGPLPLRLKEGPAACIACLAFHPSGHRLFTGDTGGTITMWEVGTWRKLKTWSAHAQPIESLQVSRDGSKLVSSAYHENIVVWDAETSQEICSLPAHRYQGRVGISPDGRELATDTQGNRLGSQIVFTSAETGTIQPTLGPAGTTLHSDPQWSPDGRFLAFIDDSRSLAFFNVQTRLPLAGVGKLGNKNADDPFAAVWFADSTRLVTAGWGKDEIDIVQVGKAKPVQTISAGGGSLRCVALHPAEQWIATCGHECPVQLWHLPTSRLVKSWQLGPPKGKVHQVAFSPDGHYLATVNGNGTVYVLSLDGVLKE